MRKLLVDMSFSAAGRRLWKAGEGEREGGSLSFALGRKERKVGAYVDWRRGVVVSGVRRLNEVNAHRARLVPGWVTVFGRVYHLGM